ncbi:MAG TPA: GGDEF domain-containing protein [Chloroflexota bacterium]
MVDLEGNASHVPADGAATDFGPLRQWIEGRWAEARSDPKVEGRVEFWTGAVQQLEAATIGMLIALKELNEERDGLTGILNRRGLEAGLRSCLMWADRMGEPVTLVFMDVDHFKLFNDKFGHAAGDEVLRAWAQFLASNIRPTDVVGRYGGEEIVAVLRNCTEEQGHEIFDRVRGRMSAALSGCLTTFGIVEPVTMSVGVAQYQPPESELDLIKRSDARLYRAKESGRNLVFGGSD